MQCNEAHCREMQRISAWGFPYILDNGTLALREFHLRFVKLKSRAGRQERGGLDAPDSEAGVLTPQPMRTVAGTAIKYFGPDCIQRFRQELCQESQWTDRRLRVSALFDSGRRPLLFKGYLTLNFLDQNTAVG